MAKAPDREKNTTVPHIAQSIGGRYGIGTGVNAESCSARGWGSKPLLRGSNQHSELFFWWTYEEKSWVTGESGLFDLRGPAAGGKFRTTGAEFTPI